MHRSASSMWRACIENTGLPTCPPELSEPKYVSILYLPICSFCGAQVQRKPDGYLLVRLCGRCRRARLIRWAAIEPEVLQTVVLFSSESPANSEYFGFSLKQELEKLRARLNELRISNNKGAIQAWLEYQEVMLQTRKERGDIITWWIENIHHNQMQARRDVWRKQAERRLVALGYSLPDKDFPDDKRRRYKTFFNRVDGFNSHKWNIIKPRVIELLETEVKERPERQREERRNQRETQLGELLSQLLGQLATTMPEHLAKLSVTQQIAFLANWTPIPKASSVLGWPIFDGWVDSEIPVEVITERFNAQREEITQLVIDWGELTKREFATMARKDREQGQLTTDLPHHSLPVTRGGEHLSRGVDTDTGSLLRADSLFKLKGYAEFWPYNWM
ncbi:hypothetical protein FRC12_012618, partial [Ceratobasidium sp. 428]